jgi:hypothetical protein
LHFTIPLGFGRRKLPLSLAVTTHLTWIAAATGMLLEGDFDQFSGVLPRIGTDWLLEKNHIL